MRAFTTLAKLSLGLTTTGAAAYYGHQYYFGNTQEHSPFADSPIVSDYFKEYIREHDLVTPLLYKNYQQKYKFDHFFEKGVLKELQGLRDYNLFVHKDFHDVLSGDLELPKEEKHKITSQGKIHCTFAPSSKLQGFQGLIHGGFTSTLLDNIAGCLAFMACDYTPAVTAYLNVKHEKPMKVDEEYVAILGIEKMEGRKIFIKGQIVDKEKNVYTTLDTLYIKANFDNFYIKHLFKSLLLDNKSNNVNKGVTVIPEQQPLVKSVPQ